MARPESGPAAEPVLRAAYVLAEVDLDWRASLGAETLLPGAVESHQETVLDGFDRRLQRAGVRLLASGAEPHVRCRLAGAITGEFESPRRPGFVWDLASPLSRKVAPILEGRALEAIGSLETSVEPIAVLDSEGKTVARLSDTVQRITPPTAGARPAVARRVILEGVRGYRAEFERLARRLQGTDGLELEPGELDPTTLLPAPRKLSGGRPALEPRTTAFEALARIVRSQLDVLKANHAGVLGEHDVEHLHDHRVAVRRLRSLFGEIKGVLCDEERAELEEGLGWLAASTGPPRDVDTLLLELRLAEPELRGELAPAIAALERRREQLQVPLVEALRAARYAELRRGLRRILAPKAAQRGGKRAENPFAAVVARRLEKRLHKVATVAERLGPGAAAEELHELRIACKKLRYLLEYCRGLVPRELLDPCVAPLKELQAGLGTIQDARVHAALLVETAHALEPSATLAVGRILERIQRRADGARSRHAELVKSFLSPASLEKHAELARALRSGAEEG